MDMILDAQTATTLRTPPASGWRLQPPALVSVQVDDDEDVEWQWTHFADGRSMVTGYRIVNRPQSLRKLFERRRHA
jgi:hypothetical protein